MNKGFTLVELLAVIIILGVLTLVTVVSVNPILKDAKKGLTDTQIDNIEEVASLYYIKYGVGLDDFELENPKDCINVSELIETGYIENDEVTNPKTGEKILGSVKVTYNSNNYIYEYQDNACTNYDKGIICERVESTELGQVPEGNFIAGDAYTCKVAPNKEPYKFYVLTTSEDDDMVNLIMDRNMCEDGTPTEEGKTCLVAWYSSSQTNAYGPVTAMNHLYNATKSWINIPNIEMNYTDEGNTDVSGYGTIKTTDNITKITKKDETTVTVLTDQEGYSNLKSRLPYKSEVADFNDNNVYLYENLNGSNWGWLEATKPENNISGIYGYWTLSSVADSSFDAWFVDSSGIVHHSGDICVDYDDGYGVRPVISVYKFQME